MTEAAHSPTGGNETEISSAVPSAVSSAVSSAVPSAAIPEAVVGGEPATGLCTGLDNEPAAEPLKTYALGLLSQRAYTCAGLRDKLKRKSAQKDTRKSVRRPSARRRAQPAPHAPRPPATTLSSDEMIEHLIARFKELGLLNDLNFCRQWVGERLRFRPRGKFLLDQELRAKGVPSDIREIFWCEHDGPDEVELALRILEKKRPHLKGEPFKVREKLYRHLASKGFGVDSTRKALERFFDRRADGMHSSTGAVKNEE